MKNLALAATTLGLAVGAAHAGSIQRDGDRSQILFEEGKNYLQFSVVNVSPSVSGTFAGVNSGNIANTYQSYSLGYKTELSDKLTFALVANNPVGADVQYAANTPYFFSGSNAEIESLALTAYLKYQVSERFSVYGGLRLQSLEGNVQLQAPTAAPGLVYTLAVDSDYQLGYVLGGAYEIPDIALRVALTYESKIEHDFRDNNGVPFDVEIPQALTLHARTGIAADTLVFGSVRWQEWTEFQVAPQDFLANPLNAAGLPIAFGTEDFITYELGVGRRFNENWSGALTLGYEEGGNVPVGNLEGRDGFVSYGASVRYTAEQYDVTFGVRYLDLGSANTTTIGANFQDNDALAFGLQLGYRF